MAGVSDICTELEAQASRLSHIRAALGQPDSPAVALAAGPRAGAWSTATVAKAAPEEYWHELQVQVQHLASHSRSIAASVSALRLDVAALQGEVSALSRSDGAAALPETANAVADVATAASISSSGWRELEEVRTSLYKELRRDADRLRDELRGDLVTFLSSVQANVREKALADASSGIGATRRDIGAWTDGSPSSGRKPGVRPSALKLEPLSIAGFQQRFGVERYEADLSPARERLERLGVLTPRRAGSQAASNQTDGCNEGKESGRQSPQVTIHKQGAADMFSQSLTRSFQRGIPPNRHSSEPPAARPTAITY